MHRTSSCVFTEDSSVTEVCWICQRELFECKAQIKTGILWILRELFGSKVQFITRILLVSVTNFMIIGICEVHNVNQPDADKVGSVDKKFSERNQLFYVISNETNRRQPDWIGREGRSIKRISIFKPRTSLRF